MKTKSLPRVARILSIPAAVTVEGSSISVNEVIDLRNGIGPTEVIDLRDHVDVPVERRLKDNPRWLSLACSWHQAGRNPGPIALDLILGSSALLVAGASLGGAVLGTAVLLAAGLLFGLWKRRLPYETQGVLWYAGHLTPAAAAVGFALAVGLEGITTDAVALATIALSLTLIAVRAVLWLVIGSARRHGMGLQPALVIGPARRIEQIAHRLRTYPETGLRFEAGFTPGPGSGDSPESGRTLVNSLLSEHDVDHVICVPEQVEETVFLDFVRFSKGQVDVSLVLPLATLCAGQVRSSIGDLGVLPLRLRPSWGSAFAKRALDVCCAALLLAVLSPFLAAIALAIRLSDGGPALFRQPRVGRDGQVFTIFKFRSMVQGAESLQDAYVSQNVVQRGLLFKLDGDPRITPIGSIIRRFSIDELPQLLNVLRGDMSLVGPRPLAVQPGRFDIRAQIRHQVNPGMTGLWQALGANALEYEDMLNLDLGYVTSRTLGVDVLTMLRTVPALVIRRAPY